MSAWVGCRVPLRTRPPNYQSRVVDTVTEVLLTMSFISRGFRGRPREQAAAGRLPPGQYLQRGFPVLSAGPTPETPLTDWTVSITGEIDEPRRWSWDEFRTLPTETVTQDIHCVTKW